MIDLIKEAGFWFFDMTNILLDFLSNCPCVTKKLETKPKPYSKKKPIIAEYPMHIFCIDLYTYDGEHYLTGMDVFSRFGYCDYTSSKEADVVKEAYEDMTSLLGEPEILLHDGGGEFTLIEAENKEITAAYHPQQNGILERWHKELGKISRIHQCTPKQAVKYLRTPQQKLLFFSELKLRYLDKTVSVIDYKVRVFKPHDLVWRTVPSRSRAKHEDSFTGPTESLKDWVNSHTILQLQQATGERSK